MLKTENKARNFSRSLYSSPEFRNRIKFSPKCWQNKLASNVGREFFIGSQCLGTETFCQLKSSQKKNLQNFHVKIPPFPCPPSNNSSSDLTQDSQITLKFSSTQPIINPNNKKNSISSTEGLNYTYKPVENCISKCIYYMRSDPKAYIDKDCCIIHPRVSNIKGQYLFALCDSAQQNELNNAKNIKNSIIKIFNYKLEQIIKPIKYMQLSTLVKESIIEFQDQTKLQLPQNSEKKPSLTCVLVIGNKLACGNIGKSKIIIGQKTKSWQAKQIFQNSNLTTVIPSPEKFTDKNSKPSSNDLDELNIQEYQLSKCDKFIIIANEAFWAFISSQEAVEIISMSWNKRNPNKYLNLLINEAVIRWKKYSSKIQNIAVIVAFVNKKDS